MDKTDGPVGDAEARGVDRRRLLKGAAAAGIGVAAWSAPGITSLGGTPVYAANCTGPVTRYFLGQRNTSCDCDDPIATSPNKYVQYKWPYTSNCNQTVYRSLPAPGGQPDPSGPRIPTFNFGNSGECPPNTTKSGQAGTAAVTIPGGSDFCVIKVIVTLNQCSQATPLATASTGIVGSTSQTVSMPRVLCASGGTTPSSIFLSLYLECADDDACLTDLY